MRSRLVSLELWSRFNYGLSPTATRMIAAEGGTCMAEETTKRVNIEKDLLAILCCPETKQAVSLADDQLIDKLNVAISKGELKNKAKKPVAEKLDGGLVRADNKILYPIREDIPVMLIDEGIPLEQVS
jgi:uncharacterized protein YbaR (Trm112 family)